MQWPKLDRGKRRRAIELRNHQLSGADHVVLWGRQRVLQRKMRVAERPGGVLEPGMSGSRKSDNNIVPEKPANNEVKTFAEQVEGRALTEGNTMNTAAVRTQGRGAASTGLDGVRKNFSVITRGRRRMS